MDMLHLGYIWILVLYLDSLYSSTGVILYSPWDYCIFLVFFIFELFPYSWYLTWVYVFEGLVGMCVMYTCMRIYDMYICVDVLYMLYVHMLVSSYV